MEFRGKRPAPRTAAELEEARLLEEARAFEQGIDPEPVVPDENFVVRNIRDDEEESED